MRARFILGSILLGAVALACSAADPTGPVAEGERPAPASAAPPSASTCGDGVCSDGETCQSCAEDCGVCTVCPLARSCKTGVDAPASMPALPSLDVKFERIPRERVLANLAVAADQGHPGLLLLSRAIAAGPSSDPNVVGLRRFFAARPDVESVVRRQLGRPELAAALARAHVIPGEVVPLKLMNGDDKGDDAGGPVDCSAPKLRLRVASIDVKEPDDDLAGDIVFCTIAARGREGASGKLTPRTPNLGSKSTFAFTPFEGTFWGAGKTPEDAKGDLEIRYDCFEADSPHGYDDIIKQLTSALGVAGVLLLPGYGWVAAIALDFVGSVLPSILALDGDDHLLSAAQVIPRAQQIALANGASWSIHKQGTHLLSDWDWTLRVQAFGCTDNGTAP